MAVVTLAAITQGCAELHTSKQLGTMNVIVQTQYYAIGQSRENDTFFLIWADTAARAQEAANLELGCRKNPCITTHGGVITVVERPVPSK